MECETSSMEMVGGIIPFGRISSRKKEQVHVLCFAPVLYETLPLQTPPTSDPLMLHIVRDDIEYVKACISDKQLHVNTCIKEGYTILHAAVVYKSEAIVKWLLKNGADPNLTDTNGQSAVMVAAESGYNDVVETLIEYKADVNQFSYIGWTALFYAAVNEHKEVMNKLVNHGASLDLADKDERTIFIVCCILGLVSPVMYLMKLGADRMYKNSQNEDALMASAAFGRTSLVQFLVQSGLDVNSRSKSGMTALMFAAANRYYQAVLYLMRRVADLNQPNNEGDTALILAVKCGDLKSIKALKEQGARLDILNNDMQTCHTIANEEQHSAVQEYFKTFQPDGSKEGIESSSENKDFSQLSSDQKQRHLFHYCWMGKTNQVKALLNAGTDVNCKDTFGRQPLMAACQAGHNDTVKALLDHGADVNHQDHSNMTALAFAISYDHLATSRLLRNAGTNIELTDKHGSTVLLCSCRLRCVRPFMDLHQLGAYIFHADNNGKNALMIAAESGNMEIVQFLVAHGVPIDVTCRNGLTAIDYAFANEHDSIYTWLCTMKEQLRGHYELSCELHIAASCGNAERIEKLIEKGLTIYDHTWNGIPALCTAVCFGHLEVVQELLRYGATVNIQWSSGGAIGCTPLWINSIWGRADIVECLFQNNANPNIADAEGLTPLMICAYHDHSMCVELLLGTGAFINQRARDGKTALLFSILSGKTGAVRALLRHRPNLDSTDIDGRTALMFAVERGHSDQVLFLVDSGCDVNISDSSGKTAVTLAQEFNHCSIARYLISKGAKPSEHMRLKKMEDLHYSLTSNSNTVPNIVSTNVADLQDRPQVALMEKELKPRIEIEQDHNDKTSTVIIAQTDEYAKSEARIDAKMNTIVYDDEIIFRVNEISDNAYYLDESVSQNSPEEVKSEDTDKRSDSESLIQSIQGTTIPTEVSIFREVLLFACTNGTLLEQIHGVRLSKENLNFVDVHGRTPLMLAIINGIHDVAKWLLQLGADVNICDSAGMTALMFLCCNSSDTRSNRKSSDYFLKSVKKLDIPDFHRIYHNPHDMVCQLLSDLLQSGRCDIGVKDAKGRTALHLACICGNAKTVQILLEYNACVVSVDNIGRNALCQVVTNGLQNQVDIIQLLLSHGSNINQVDNNGDSALMLSIECGNEDVLRLLLSYDINVNHANNTGETALSLASLIGICWIFEALIELCYMQCTAGYLRSIAQLILSNHCEALFPMLPKLFGKTLDLVMFIQSASAQNSVTALLSNSFIKHMLFDKMFALSHPFVVSEDIILWYCQHVYPNPIHCQGFAQALKSGNYKIAKQLYDLSGYDGDQYCIITCN